MNCLSSNSALRVYLIQKYMTVVNTCGQKHQYLAVALVYVS